MQARTQKDNLRHHMNSICCISHLPTHTHTHQKNPTTSVMFLKVLFQPPTHPPPHQFDQVAVYSTLIIFFFFSSSSQDHEIKIYTWIPRALVIRLHIFYSEIKRQRNECWNLTPCCSGHAKVMEINFTDCCRGRMEKNE